VLAFESDGRFIAEIHEQPSRWNGWPLPLGLLIVRAEDLPTVEPRLEHGEASRPDCYVIVSDSLGPDSLTLLGIFERKSKGADHGG